MTPGTALLGIALAQSALQPFLALEAGRWRGGGYARPDGGVGHCALTRSDDGSRVSLSVSTRGALRLSLADAALAPGDVASAAVVVDGVAHGDFPATRSDGELVVDLGPDSPLAARLRGAEAVEVRTARGTLRARIAGAGPALARLRECVALRDVFARAPTTDPGAASDQGGAPRPHEEARERLRTLLRASGLDGVDFAPPATLGVASARFAWTSGTLLGFATLESRNERSLAELERHHARVYAARCDAPPVQRTLPGVRLAGYTLYQTTVECPVQEGVRIAVVTSVLDALDVLSLVHMGLAVERERLEHVHASLGRVLGVLLRR